MVLEPSSYSGLRKPKVLLDRFGLRKVSLSMNVVASERWLEPDGDRL